MNELYQSLAPGIREELSKYEEQTIVPAGRKLISEGVIPEHLIAIERGSVEISVSAGNKPMSLSVAGKGKVLGLRSILINAPPEVEATTLEECAIVRIPRDIFLNVLEEHPEIYFAVSKVLGADLNTAERFLRKFPRAARNLSIDSSTT